MDINSLKVARSSSLSVCFLFALPILLHSTKHCHVLQVGWYPCTSLVLAVMIVAGWVSLGSPASAIFLVSSPVPCADQSNSSPGANLHRGQLFGGSIGLGELGCGFGIVVVTSQLQLMEPLFISSWPCFLLLFTVMITLGTEDSPSRPATKWYFIHRAP